MSNAQRQAKQEASSADARKSNQSSGQNAPSDHDRRKESSRLSQQALAAQKKAHELRQAANGAADPDERQHLMEEAINRQIEAESLGKTAKYLQSGTFQGMAVGAGMGTVPGLTLGTLTGTLVGSISSLVLGGLGGAVGAATGALHGPFWNMGELAGKGIRKITGDLPGWKATTEQKNTLEKMIGQAHEQDTPSEADLGKMAEWESPGNGDRQGSGREETQTWAEYGASYLHSIPTKTEPESSHSAANSGAKVESKGVQRASNIERRKSEKPMNSSASNTPAVAQIASRKRGEPDRTNAQPQTRATTSRTQGHDNSSDQVPDQSNSTRPRPRRPTVDESQSQQKPSGTSPEVLAPGRRKKPRKLVRQQPSEPTQGSPPLQARKTPRKLDSRQTPRKLNTKEPSSKLNAQTLPRKLDARRPPRKLDARRQPRKLDHAMPSRKLDDKERS